MAKIFISYRREDTAAAAGRIYDRLLPHFGKDQLFMDVDTIEPGERFSDVVQRTVGSCDVLLALIGDRWLTVQDSSGQTRLSNPDDWVRLEVATALRRDIRVIPILINGASVPRRTDLPDDLTDLALRHALDITHVHFHSDVDRLVQTLDRALSRETSSPPSVPLISPTTSKESASNWAVESSKSDQIASNHDQDRRLWAVRLAVALINLPFATLTLPKVFPPWFDVPGNLGGMATRWGICFGLVVIVWNIERGSDLLRVRNLVFLAASVASALVAFWVQGKIGGALDIWAIMISGAICLALANRFLLRCTTKQAIAAVAGAPLVCYLLAQLGNELLSKDADAVFGNYIPLFWQLGYLLGINGAMRLKIKPFWQRAQSNG